MPADEICLWPTEHPLNLIRLTPAKGRFGNNVIALYGADRPNATSRSCT